MANQSQSFTHAFTIHPSSACSLRDARSVPAVVLDHVGELDNELALLVLLTALKGMFLGTGGERETKLTAGLTCDVKLNIIYGFMTDNDKKEKSFMLVSFSFEKLSWQKKQQLNDSKNVMWCNLKINLIFLPP